MNLPLQPHSAPDFADPPCHATGFPEPAQPARAPNQQRAPLHIVTPLLDAEIGGRRVGLKLENLQPSRSFKLRGIGLLCQHHADQGVQRFVCSSAGNAGYAVAWAGRALAIAVTVVVPRATPAFVVDRIAALGAEVVVKGEVWDQANAAALALAQEPGSAYIPPFDHPLLWRGHSTLVEELASQCSQVPDALVLAVGGGGLLLGVLEGLRRVGWNNTTVFAVEPERAAALGPSLRANRVLELPQPRSIASSLCVMRPASSLVAACRGHRVSALTVSDDDIASACARFANEQGLLVEPACGVALAPVYNGHPALAACRNIVSIVCGGIVVTLDQVAAWSAASQSRMCHQ